MFLKIFFYFLFDFVLERNLAKSSSTWTDVILEFFKHFIVFLFSSPYIVMQFSHLLFYIFQLKFPLFFSKFIAMGNNLINFSLNLSLK